MEASGNCINPRLDGRRILEDLFDARMRTSDYDYQALQCAERERDLIHLHRAGLLGLRGDDEETRKDFRRLRDHLEVSLLPRRARNEPRRLLPTVILHVRG